MQASFARRFLAIAIDWVMCQGIAALLVRHHLGAAAFLPLGIFFLEVFLLTTLTGSSAGQRICGLRVVSVNASSYLSPLRVFERTVLLCLVFPALLTKAGRGYHDWLSSTVVTRVLQAE